MFIYWVLFGLIVIGIAIYFDRQELEKIIFIIIGIVLILFAGLRAVDVSRDSMNYTYMFDRVNFYSDWLYSSQELMAVYVPVTLKYLGIYSYLTMFMIFALLGVSIKFIAIRRYSALPMLSVLFYYVTSYLLHEMIQIRAGVATGILLLSVTDIYNKNFMRFLLKVGIASLFHISSLVFIPFYFINPNKINRLLYYLGLIIVVIIGIRGVNVFTLFPGLGGLNAKLQAYQKFQNFMREVNLLSIGGVLNIILVIVLIQFSNQLRHVNQYAIIITKMLYFSIVSLFLFSAVSIIAWRISELFGVASFIAFTYLLYLIRPKIFLVIMLIIMAAGLFSLNLYRQGLMQPYHTILD